MHNDSDLDVSEFRRLLDDVRDGSSDAAWKLVELYGPHVWRAVRRRLDPNLRRHFESVDFVQAVWASFFAHGSRLFKFESPVQLIAALTTIARNKVIDQLRRHVLSSKRNMHRERSLDAMNEEHSGHLVSSEPTPSQVAIARERWRLMLDHEPPHYRQIAELRLIGMTHREIAGRLSISEKTVQRVIRMLMEKLAA